MPGAFGPVTVQPRAILVRSVNWLGDAVMTTPALLRLREHFPQARITLLSPSKLAELWAHHPALDSTLAFGPHESLLRVARRLRADQFDLAVVFPNSPRSALEPWLAGIPRRVGYAHAWRNWFLTEAVLRRAERTPMRKRPVREIRNLRVQRTSPARQSIALGPSVHQIHEYLGLAAALGANPAPLRPRLVATTSEAEAVATKFNLHALFCQDRPVLGLNPGAEYGPAKRWPVERFAAAALDIHARTGAVWLIVGGPADVALSGSLEAAFRQANAPSALKNLCGQTTLRELMALLTRCRLLLTNDTGPMHLAAALGTPVVALFGSTAPELTGPGLPDETAHHLVRGQAPCAPCFRRSCPIDFRCMTGISVDQVAEQVVETLASHPGAL